VCVCLADRDRIQQIERERGHGRCREIPGAARELRGLARAPLPAAPRRHARRRLHPRCVRTFPLPLRLSLPPWGRIITATMLVAPPDPQQVEGQDPGRRRRRRPANAVYIQQQIKKASGCCAHCSVPGVADDGAGGGGEQPHHLRVRGAALPAAAGGQRGDQLRRHRLHPLAPRRLPLRLLRRLPPHAARLRRRRARGTYAMCTQAGHPDPLSLSLSLAE
jgi:hypothetical protein